MNGSVSHKVGNPASYSGNYQVKNVTGIYRDISLSFTKVP
jgi:hypothetical protein